MTPDTSAYWFRPRTYGHGAAPSIWQGWAAIVAFPIACALVTLALFAWLTPMVAFVAFAIAMPLAVFGFISFVRKRTDGPWR